MRRAIRKALNKYDVRSANEQVISKRGALKTLPVMFGNDMV